MYAALLHLMFTTISLLLALASISLALPQILQIPPDPFVSFNSSVIGIGPDFTFDTQFGSRRIDPLNFPVTTLVAAVQISQNSADATVPSQRLLVAEYPGCVLSILCNPESSQDLTVRLVVQGLYQAAAAMATRAKCTELGMPINYNGELVGYLAWQRGARRNLSGLGNVSTSLAVADFLPTLSTLNITILASANYVGLPNDPLKTTPSFLSEVQMSSWRVFVTLLDGINNLLVYPSKLNQPFSIRSVKQRAQIDISTAQGVHSLGRKDLVRVLGRISIFYASNLGTGFAETITKVFWNGTYAATARLLSWDPSSEVFGQVGLLRH